MILSVAKFIGLLAVVVFFVIFFFAAIFDCPHSKFGCLIHGVYSCIPKSWKCDGDGDCDNAEDEYECRELGFRIRLAEGTFPKR